LRVDVERAYAGAFIICAAACETAIERLFVGLLVGDLSSATGVARALVTVKSRRVAHGIIRGERPYVDWLPYRDRTKPRANSFFSLGKPFSMLSSGSHEALEDMRIIRNALAHESKSAVSKFQKRLVDGLHLPLNQHRPAPYLRAPHHGTLTRMDVILTRVIQALRDLCV
jgi:hypothetical protein